MIELHTLGDCQIVAGDERLGPQSPYAFALALFLAIERGRPHSRDELVATFFPGVPEHNASHSLRQTLYKLRQLGVPAETTPAGTIIPAAAVRDDYSALLATHELPDPRAERLPGEFLPGYWPKISDDFARWLDAQRDAVNGALRRAYVARILDRRAVARWDEVERFARACLVVDPLNEEATLALAEALALSGSKAAAVKLLDKYVEEVGAELGSLALPAAVLKKRISERVRSASAMREMPLFGRESEMTELNKALIAAMAGEERVVWIHGEPGIGKTALATDFVRAVTLSGTRTAEVASQSHSSHRPLGLFLDLLPRLLEQPGALGCAPDKLATLRRIVPGSLDQAEIAVERDRLMSIDQIRLALDELLDSIAAEAPLLLALDDLQWADRVSLDILYQLCSRTRRRPLLVIALSRTVPPDLPSSIQVLRLRSLEVHFAEQLVRHAMGRTGSPPSEEGIAKVLAAGAGNPFYLRSLAEHLLFDPRPTRLPTRVTELIEHRTRQCSDSSLAILVACASLTVYATIERIESVLGIRRLELARELHLLETHNLIHVVDGRLEITHDIVSECVLAAAPPSVLLLLRKACASVLETAARSDGNLGMFWAAHDCWTAAHDTASATRCATDAITMDVVHGLLDRIDARPRIERVPEHARARANAAMSRSPLHTIADAATPPAAYDVRDASTRVRWLLALIKDPSYSPATRLRAAVTALSILEHSALPEQATEVFTAALPCADSAKGDARLDYCRLMLAYHTVFGDQDQALQLAGDHEFGLIRYHNHAADMRSMMNAGEALARCGHPVRAIHLFERAYAECESAGLAIPAVELAVRAAWLARQLDELSRFALWRERSCREASDPSSISYAGHTYNEILAVLDSSPEATVDALIAALNEASPAPSRYHCALVDALRIRNALRHGQTAQHATVHELRVWSLSTCYLVPEDDVALAVYEGLLHLGGQDAADDYLTSYAAQRRKRYMPLLPQLETIRRTSAQRPR